jgi:hypothetical protein
VCAPRPPAAELLLLGESGILAVTSTSAALTSLGAANRKKKGRADCQLKHAPQLSWNSSKPMREAHTTRR